MKGVVDALSRLSGVTSVTVKLQANRVIAATDRDQPVLPQAIWNAILRVGFTPKDMEVWSDGSFGDDAFALGDAHWPVVGSAPSSRERRSFHLKVADGAEDPPRVTLVE